MNSLTSFLGKCMTLLLGGALSWYSIAHPGGAKLAKSILGDSQRTSLPKTLSASVPRFAPPPPNQRTRDVAAHNAALTSAEVGQPESPEERMVRLSTQLRQLGASYLLVEKLTLGSDDRYRVRCDLANENSSVKCCFEATQPSPVLALEDVLDAVRQMEDETSRKSVGTLASQT